MLARVKLRKTLSALIAVSALVIPSAAPLHAQEAVQALQAWNYETYRQAMVASGRDIGGLDEKAFQAAADRKRKVLDQIRSMPVRSFGSANPVVMRAFEEIPREYYMYDYERGNNLAGSAYEWLAREWKTGCGSVLTDLGSRFPRLERARPTLTHYPSKAFLNCACAPTVTNTHW